MKKHKLDLKFTVNLDTTLDINAHHLVMFIRNNPSMVRINVNSVAEFVIELDRYDPDWVPYPGWSA